VKQSRIVDRKAAALAESADVRVQIVRGIHLVAERFRWIGGASEEDTYTREELRRGMLDLASELLGEGTSSKKVNPMSKKPFPAGYETFDVSVTPCIAIHESDLRAGGWIREKDAANVLSDENVALRVVLTKLLELDAKRPADTTFWARWWDETVAEAKTLLGGTYPRNTTG